MDTHALAIAALRGLCAGDPSCTAPATAADDCDPNILRCPAHALAHLRRLTHQGAPA